MHEERNSYGTPWMSKAGDLGTNLASGLSEGSGE